MQALVHDRFGEPREVIALRDVPMPEPGSGEVRLRLSRAAIHNHDLATIRGVYGYKPQLPAVAGTEMVGVVDALGEGVTTVTVGTRVAAMGPGAWSEYVIAPAQMLVPMPPAISDDVAAQLLAMPMSAVVLFDDLKIPEGGWMLQNAANGAVGRIVMRLAQDRGVNVINLVRRAQSVEELRSFGAQHVVDSEEPGWADTVRALTGGKGVDRIVDSVAGPATMDLQRLLARGGELVIFGGLSGAAVKLDPSLMISLECTVRGFWMSAWMTRATSDQRAHVIQRVFELALRGQLPLPVGGVYPLAQAAQALEAAERPGRPGKILFTP